MAEQRLNLSDVMSGAEPTFKDIKPDLLEKDNKILLMRALGWYSREKTLDDSLKYFISYFKSENISAAISPYVVSNLGHVCRIITRGFPMSKYIQDKLDAGLIRAKKATIQAKSQAKVKAESDAKVVKQEVYVVPGAIIDPKVNAYLNQFDEFVDSVITDGVTKSINLHSLGFNKIQKNQIVSYILKFKAGWDGCTDEEIGLTSKVKRTILTFCDKLLLEVGTSPVKIPRLKKPVSKEKQVEKLKISPKSTVDKEQLIGAKVAIFFDEEARRLRLYMSEDGFKVKGTTLLNFDPDKSYVKTVRKPEEQLERIKNLAKVPLLKHIELIKCKAARCNGRLNEGLTLLKVY